MVRTAAPECVRSGFGCDERNQPAADLMLDFAFGWDGLRGDQTAYDHVIQAVSGLMVNDRH